MKKLCTAVYFCVHCCVLLCIAVHSCVLLCSAVYCCALVFFFFFWSKKKKYCRIGSKLNASHHGDCWKKKKKCNFFPMVTFFDGKFSIKNMTQKSYFWWLGWWHFLLSKMWLLVIFLMVTFLSRQNHKKSINFFLVDIARQSIQN